MNVNFCFLRTYEIFVTFGMTVFDKLIRNLFHHHGPLNFAD